ncbi:squalene synthase HpnC [Noviherbaspirillum aridicola]|uniref:Squalene synthase HpnC n=1 Tax=Noviherbaspirillum aridicola TaxID=2849687 RepID=A0ABQ4Q2V3_9BURK|nr:squalene synthase HpnC [Noviherbaspirillum aridicola]GIZ51513.1 squalene synthase HpnC [Noviherbaspirillum aridicola]
MPVEHYENFPVASLLLPARLRPPVEAVYAFARGADDIADEGDATPEERLRELDRYETALDRIAAGTPDAAPPFGALARAIREYDLPLQPLRDLLSAFRQDVVTKRYRTHAELLDYCNRSANPVGRLMLHLYEQADARNLRDADAICTALQLINFWQDVAVDWEKGRIYLPQEDMARFGVSEDCIARGDCNAAWQSLMRFEVARARALMLSGADLPLRVRGRIGWELRMVIQGGLRILERIEAAGHDVFRRRPRLGAWDWLLIGWRALRMKMGLSRSTQLG